MRILAWANRGERWRSSSSPSPWPIAARSRSAWHRSHYRLDIPIWALVVGALVVGFLSGALVRWLLDHKVRRMARRGPGGARCALEQELAGRARKQLDEAVRGQRAAVPAASPASLTPKDLV